MTSLPEEVIDPAASFVYTTWLEVTSGYKSGTFSTHVMKACEESEV